jgi:predicted nucleotidyltransferase
MSTEKIGERLRRLREEKGWSLRKVAAIVDIDVAILSKMERGERRLSKDMIQKLARLYEQDTDELMVLFLSEKVIFEIGDDELAIKALQVAEERVAYSIQKNNQTQSILHILIDFFKEDKRVEQAWLFGSFARNDQNSKSDIDLMVRFNPQMKISLFDYADIAHLLESKTNRRIDLVEEGCLQPFVLETAKKDLVKIYG